MINLDEMIRAARLAEWSGNDMNCRGNYCPVCKLNQSDAAREGIPHTCVLGRLARIHDDES